jgi:hypothetical protein
MNLSRFLPTLLPLCHLLLSSSNPVLIYYNDPHPINTSSWSIINHIVIHISTEMGVGGFVLLGVCSSLKWQNYHGPPFLRHHLGNCLVFDNAKVTHDFVKNFLIGDMPIKSSFQVLKRAQFGVIHARYELSDFFRLQFSMEQSRLSE